MIICDGPGPHNPPSGVLGEGDSTDSARCSSVSCDRFPTAEQIAQRANERTIQDRLLADLAEIDLITATVASAFTQAGVRDLQRQVKDLARMNKRLIRLTLKVLNSTE